MNKYVFVLAMIFLTGMFQVSAQEAEPKKALPDTLQVSGNDTTEYELIVSDPGFHSWFLTNARPKWYHEKPFYEMKNRFFVTAWNDSVTQTMARPPYEYYIDYNPQIDYGLDLNYKLYWYFKYVEAKYGVNLGID
ncbi:MAG: DUF6146 family protein [Bacteroidales bacterium]